MRYLAFSPLPSKASVISGSRVYQSAHIQACHPATRTLSFGSVDFMSSVSSSSALSLISSQSQTTFRSAFCQLTVGRWVRSSQHLTTTRPRPTSSTRGRLACADKQSRSCAGSQTTLPPASSALQRRICRYGCAGNCRYIAWLAVRQRRWQRARLNFAALPLPAITLLIALPAISRT